MNGALFIDTVEDIYTGHILRGAVQEKIEESLNYNAENTTAQERDSVS